MAADGTRVRQLTFDRGIQEVPRWSPNGRWIAFNAAPVLPWEPGFSTSIWVMRADGTATPGDDGRLRRRAGLVTGRLSAGLRPPHRRRQQVAAVYVANHDGSGLHEVVPPTAGLEHPDWSPDGRWITFNIAPEAPNDPRNARSSPCDQTVIASESFRRRRRATCSSSRCGHRTASSSLLAATIDAPASSISASSKRRPWRADRHR